MALWTKGAIIIGCRQNTLEFVDSLLAQNHPVSGIVTLNQKSAIAADVPEWADLKSAFGEKIPVYVAQTYKLSSENDSAALRGSTADIGFCIGWQRILPPWFLSSCRNGIFGMHTCQHPLPNGRGRSPINWSLIEGADSLHAHIFRYEDTPDGGLLLDVTKFPVLPHDDINTLQQACRAVFSQVVSQRWQELLQGTPKLFEQDKTQPDRFYPKRAPEDGGIDWHWTARQVTDWVRAQTRPYPGAFTQYEKNVYKIWRCAPVGIDIKGNFFPGIIIEKFADGTYFVQTGHGAVHLLDHDLPRNLTLGTQLTCLSCAKKIPIRTSA